MESKLSRKTVSPPCAHIAGPYIVQCYTNSRNSTYWISRFDLEGSETFLSEPVFYQHNNVTKDGEK
ncbi:hypothetical protein MJO28_016736 [Puccinia striiformis f. sp. tritici]|uniref:Uncharacterized protein n=1 Tax=Puccinia striiformis f. sp. tritici TaxID=168172 RepID=A0ACC0DQP5_9BASI|nr:hypothetical protein MJO28_016736 [Puccinia striiformis f. sp. tritici]